MDKKNNYFGRELERALLSSGVKHYTIAKALNYDVSYISKWISGKMLPSAKNAERICAVISAEICSQAAESKLKDLAGTYGVTDPEKLQHVIGTALTDAYNVSAGRSSLEKYINNANLTVRPSGNSPLMLDFCREIDGTEPVNIAVIADIFSMEHTAKLLLAGISEQRFLLKEPRENIHLHFIISMDKLKGEHIYDVILLIHFMTHYSLTSFQLFYSEEAAGKLMIAVEGSYSGITVLSGQQFLCTASSRDRSVSEQLYKTIVMEEDPDRKLFYHTTMKDLLLSHEYIRCLLSQDIKWLCGHLTEHFLSPDLFAEICQRVWPESPELQLEARRTSQVALRSAEKNGLKLMIYDTALTNFILSGELDFFNHKIILTPEERKEQLAYMKELLTETAKLEVKMIRGGFSDDFKYITNPCIFLSESAQMLRLENQFYVNNVFLVQDKAMQEIFQKFFDEIWLKRQDVVLSDRRSLQKKLENLLESADLLAQM